MQGNQGFFKQCVSCRGKIPPLDGHNRCLLCLGEGHRPDTCCQKFSRRARKDHETRLKLALLESALRPQTMADLRSSATSSRPSPPSASAASTASMTLQRSSSASAPVSSKQFRPSNMAPTHRPSSSASASASGPSTPVVKPKEKKEKHKVKKPKPDATTENADPAGGGLQDNPPEKILASPVHQATLVVLSSSGRASVSSRASVPGTLTAAVSAVPPTAERRQEQISFDEVHLAYVFPCTGSAHPCMGSALQVAETQGQLDPLREELVRLAADLPRYHHHGLTTQRGDGDCLVRQLGADPRHRGSRSRSPHCSRTREDPARREKSRHRH